MGIRQRAAVVVELTPEDCELLSGELAAALANARRVAPVGQRVQALAEDVARLARVARNDAKLRQAADQRVSRDMRSVVDSGGPSGGSSERSASVSGSSRAPLSAGDVAAQMGVTGRRVQQLAAEHGIGDKDDRGRLRFSERDAERLMETRRMKATR